MYSSCAEGTRISIVTETTVVLQMYAPEGHKHEKEFNCVQRAHQNLLENIPTAYILLFLAGVVCVCVVYVYYIW